MLYYAGASKLKPFLQSLDGTINLRLFVVCLSREIDRTRTDIAMNGPCANDVDDDGEYDSNISNSNLYYNSP